MHVKWLFLLREYESAARNRVGAPAGAVQIGVNAVERDAASQCCGRRRSGRTGIRPPRPCSRNAVALPPCRRSAGRPGPRKPDLVSRFRRVPSLSLSANRNGRRVWPGSFASQPPTSWLSTGLMPLTLAGYLLRAGGQMWWMLTSLSALGEPVSRPSHQIHMIFGRSIQLSAL
jgi:hypothetical protein